MALAGCSVDPGQGGGAAASATKGATAAAAGSGGTRSMTGPTAAASAVSGTAAVVASARAALPALLDRHAAALRAGDVGAALADVDASATGYAARQQALAHAVPDLLAASARAGGHPAWEWHVGGDLVPVPSSAGPTTGAATTATPTVLARVVETYRLPPWQPAVEQREQWWRLRLVHGRWQVVDDVGDREHVSQRDVWDLGPVAVVASPRVLLVDQPERRTQTEHLLHLADAAVARVVRQLPPRAWSWPGAVLLVRPASDAAAAELAGEGSDTAASGAGSGSSASTGAGSDTGAGASAGGVEGLAAVTVGAPLAPAARIVLVPSGADAMSDTDAAVVLTHEVVHVATRPATRSTVPLWLAEGFADWVARQGTSVAQGAPVALARYGPSSHAPVPALPSQADLTSTANADDLECAYELSWLAVRGLAGRLGAPGVEGLYRDVAEHGSLDSALHDRGLDERVVLTLLTRQLRDG